MMRKLVIIVAIISVLLLLYGCLQASSNLSCCKLKDGECDLLNKPESIKDYTTNSCDPEKNICNITITNNNGERSEKIVPICSTEEERKCVNANCSAMVCGDFIYRPRLPPPVLTDEEKEQGIGIPTTQEEETVQSLYLADCKLLPMDENLTKIMKRSGAMINSLRFGIGYNLTQYEKYKYMFPISDSFCGINPQGTIDRYMNYYDFCNISKETKKLCDQKQIPPSFDDPLKYLSKYQCLPTNNLKEPKSIYSPLYRAMYPFIFPSEDNSPKGYITREVKIGDMSLSEIDKYEYARSLTARWKDLMYKEKQIAPFECRGSECISGYCNKQDYHRTFIVKKDGTKEPIDCYKGMVAGREVVACASVENRSFEYNGKRSDGFATVKANINYRGVSAYSLKYYLVDRGYSSSDLTEECKGDTGDDNLHALYDMISGLRGTDSGCCRSVGIAQGTCDRADVCGGKEIEFCGRTKDDEVFPYLGYSHTNQPIKPRVIKTIPKTFDAKGRELTDKEKKEGKCDVGYKVCDGNFCFCYDSNVEPGPEFPPVNTVYLFNKGGIIGYGIGSPSGSDLVKACNMKPKDNKGKGDYFVINYPDDLSTSQQALVEEVAKQMLNDSIQETLPYVGDEKVASNIDLVLASTPWVIAHRKCTKEAGKCSSILLAKPEYRILMKNNVFGLQTSENHRVWQPQNFVYDDNNKNSWEIIHNDGEAHKAVFVMGAQTIYIITSLGECKIKEGTNLPELEEYGWCEPCTYSTMVLENMGNFWNKNYKDRPDNPILGRLTSEEILVIGHMRALLTNYLRNGVMPVLDMRFTDEVGISEVGGVLFPADFKSDDKGMGPIVTMVDNVTQAKRIKEKCEKCIVAGVIPSDIVKQEPAAVGNYAGSKFSEDKNNYYEAMVVEFPITDVMESYVKENKVKWNSMTAAEKAEVVADRMFRTAAVINYMATGMKRNPVFLIFTYNLEINSKKGWPGGSAWKSSTDERRFYADFFSELYKYKDLLRKAGVIGLVYSPFEGVHPERIVPPEGGGKFCAFEEGSYSFPSSSALTKIERISEPEPLQNTESQKEQKVKLASDGALECLPCAEGERCSSSSMICDDGTTCTPPPDSTAKSFKCPIDFVSKRCTPCSERSNDYTCLFKRTGTPELADRLKIPLGFNFDSYFKKIPANQELTDLDADIIAALPKYGKCCLKDEKDRYYTYKKVEWNFGSTVPVVFSSKGSKDEPSAIESLKIQDCGFVDPALIKKSQPQLCGISKTSDEVVECDPVWLTYSELE